MGDRSRLDRVRDQVAWRACNAILHMVGTAWYRRRVHHLLVWALTPNTHVPIRTTDGRTVCTKCLTWDGTEFAPWPCPAAREEARRG